MLTRSRVLSNHFWSEPHHVRQSKIPKFRKVVVKTTVLIHFKALTKAGQLEYVDFDEYLKVVGMTLKQYLNQ